MQHPDSDVATIMQAILDSLDDDLLKPQQRREKARKRLAGQLPHPTFAHDYVASEALFHLLGGKKEGYRAMHAHHERVSHWWIRDAHGNDLDLTAAQFKMPVNYRAAKATGFRTAIPSKMASRLMERAQLRLRAGALGINLAA